jgi:sugar phosphate isomerase/epimerase
VTVPGLTASHVTLSGAGFAQTPRFTFADRCRAAADAGFTAVGLHADDPVLAGGSDGVRRALSDSGVTLGEIELLTGWARGADAVDADTVDVLVDLAREFSPHHVTAGEFGAEPVDIRQAARTLGGLAERFGEHGTLVAVEQFPWSGLRLTSTIAAILDACGPGAGAMLDVWHHRNSGATRGDLDLLAGRIVAVQLNDGLRVTEDFLAQARAARRLPGEGDLDVATLVSDLRTIGFDGAWCVESSDEALRSDPLERVARRAHDAAVAVLGG